MLKPRKKISKRELKQDKFVIFTLKAREYIESNARTLVYAGVGILVVIILVSFFVRSKRSAAIEANALLGEAQLALKQNNIAGATEKLNKLVTDLEGVKAAGQGCFLLAKLYWETDSLSQAKIYFKEYIDEYGDDDLLNAGALAGYADCLLAEENIKEAAKYYERAAKVDKEQPLTPSYMFSAARTYMEAQNMEKARDIAQDLVDNYKTSEYSSKANILLNMIKYKS